VVIWLLATLATVRYLNNWTSSEETGSDLLLIWVPVMGASFLTVGFVLRPLRRALSIAVCKALASSPSRIFMEVGVYELLKVAYRYWPKQPLTDFIGMQALHQVYDGLNEGRRRQMLEVLRQIARPMGSPLSPEALELLAEINPRVSPDRPQTTLA